MRRFYQRLGTLTLRSLLRKQRWEAQPLVYLEPHDNRWSPYKISAI
jgi:hypothetical protein